MAVWDWTPAAQAQLAGDPVRAAIFLRVQCTTAVIRLWGGIGAFHLDADIIETEGGDYDGFGELVELPAVDQLINGQASRVDFTLSGAAVTPEVARLASIDAPTIRTAPVNLGFLILGKDLQPLSPPAWVWEGVADVLEVKRDRRGGGDIRALTLSVGDPFTGRRRPPQSLWTDADQKRRSPDDRGLEQVRLYNSGTTKTWPI